MKALTHFLFSVLLVSGASAGTAFADANSAAYVRARDPGSPRSYSATHQPSGKPTKASSFAPHSGGSKRHVYGAPIQAPILHRQQKTPSTPSAPK